MATYYGLPLMSTKAAAFHLMRKMVDGYWVRFIAKRGLPKTAVAVGVPACASPAIHVLVGISEWDFLGGNFRVGISECLQRSSSCLSSTHQSSRHGMAWQTWHSLTQFLTRYDANRQTAHRPACQCSRKRSAKATTSTQTRHACSNMDTELCYSFTDSIPDRK